MLDYRQGIADEHQARAFGAIGEHRRLDVHHRSHADGIAVMLVKREDIEAEVLGIAVFVKIVMIVVGCSFAVIEFIRYSKEGTILQKRFFRQPTIWPFSKITNLHVKL